MASTGFFEDYEESGEFEYPGETPAKQTPAEESAPKNQRKEWLSFAEIQQKAAGEKKKRASKDLEGPTFAETQAKAAEAQAKKEEEEEEESYQPDPDIMYGLPSS